MVKMALFCPRLPRESEGSWQLRQQACRLYIRQFQNVDILEFDTLENLQMHYRKHTFRRILTAHSGYYPLAFWEWAGQQRIEVMDVLMRPGPTSPKPEAAEKVSAEKMPEKQAQVAQEQPADTPRRARCAPAVRRGDTRGSRYMTRQS